jgi:riboflavin biosynthesis pyrimidine reductase
MNGHLIELANWPKGSTVRAILVQNKIGQLKDLTSSSSQLSSPLDREFLKLVRNSADLVIIGAQTIRTENPPAPNCAVFVLSNSLDLDPDFRIFENEKTFILSKLAHPSLQTIVMPELSPQRILQQAAELNYEKVLIEGGGGVFKEFINANLLTEALISVTSTIGSGEILHRSKFGLNLMQQVNLAGFNFQRWLK